MNQHTRFKAVSIGLFCFMGLILAPGLDVREPQSNDLAAQATGTYTIFLPLALCNYDPDRLTHLPSDDTQPAPSPDGKAVVFRSDGDGQSDIFSVSTSGAPVINLAQTSQADEDTPIFSPDGMTIAFASDRDGDWSIYLMDADGANVRPALSGCEGTWWQSAGAVCRSG